MRRFNICRFNQVGLFTVGAVSLLSVSGLATSAQAASVDVRVTVRSMTPANSVAFAPLRVGFGTGTYDSFNEGGTASDAIISIAENGSGSAWFPAFAAAEPGATLGTVGGVLLPGATSSMVFTVDASANRYFTFGSMVVPSNDHFIGNDDPKQYMLFDGSGNLAISSISQFGSDVWDAGSELTDPATAAFLVDGDASLHAPENGLTRHNYTEFDAYSGLTTAAGYAFDRQFGAGDEIYRISFEIVPAPGAAGLASLAGLAMLRRRRAAV